LPRLVSRGGNGRGGGKNFVLPDERDAECELDAVAKLGGRAIASRKVEFPQGLAALETPPPVINVLGHPQAEADHIRVAVEEALGHAPVEIDELIRQLGAPAAAVLTVIMESALAGRYVCQPGNRVCWS
jgi:predicted Rossmann fold nucleotide-binding protein DprA/Smf involved in DNA uptake